MAGALLMCFGLRMCVGGYVQREGQGEAGLGCVEPQERLQKRVESGSRYYALTTLLEANVSANLISLAKPLILGRKEEAVLEVEYLGCCICLCGWGTLYS